MFCDFAVDIMHCQQSSRMAIYSLICQRNLIEENLVVIYFILFVTKRLAIPVHPTISY